MTRVIQRLADHVNELQAARERILYSVEEERRNGKEIQRDVLNWLENVDELIERANQLLKNPRRANVRGSTWGFPNLILRHQLSRNATKIANDVIQVLGKGMFDRVGYLPTLDGVAFFSSTSGSENYETRGSLKNDIVKALTDLNSCNVGVYGLGGVGKTTLVKEVATTAKQHKLFGEVVMTYVSENPDLKTIQGMIADSLDLQFYEEETIFGRAKRLRQRIKMETSILVILDDIWTKLDLEKVGIPIGNEHNGCKLLMTSRNQDVLLQMDVPKDFTFKLELMPENETWKLFQFMAGDVVKDGNLKDVAIQVAKQCNGLPLMIVTVARAMRNRDVRFWKHALTALQSNDRTELDALTYSALELSYNTLESDETRDIFLLLALMQGNDVEYSLKVAMSLKILKHVNTVDEARDRFYTIIRSLEATCLLLDVKEGGVIQMHNFVHNFAISIARRDKHVFLSKIPHEEWSTKDFLKRCTQIALPNYQNDEPFPLIMQDNSVEYFPDDQLSLLSYQPSFISEEDDYQERLDLLIRSNNHSLRETQEVDEQEVDGETRLSLWVDVAGGMSQGQRYSTSAMSVNLRPSVCHLTQESSPPENEGIEMLRREVAATRAEAAAANQRADVSDQRIKNLENNIADFAQRMAALENQLSGCSCNMNRPRPTPQHPHYDDDLDDQSEDGLT